MQTYTITQLRDVRAWRKVEMQFADDVAAAAHVEQLARAIREGRDVPRGHALEDASHYTDYDVQGRETFFIDIEREDGCPDEVSTPDAYTPDETAAELGYKLRDALRAILPYAESRAEDMLKADGELDGCDPSDATRKAVAAVDAAKALLASLDA